MGGVGEQDIWRSTRAAVTDSWNAPTPLSTAINTTVGDVGPSISNDFQTLYFSSDFSGNRNIWKAEP